jgi:hypothetical protein
VLLGAEPVYRVITLGTPDSSSTSAPSYYDIPSSGSNIEGIAVTLGLPLPLGLPIFYPSEVTYSPLVCGTGGTVTMGPANTVMNPTTITMPSDYLLPTFDPGNPTGTEQSLIRVSLASGVMGPTEVAVASAPPFNLPVTSPAPFQYSWQNDAFTAASSLVPSLFPLSIFSKLSSSDLTPQASPAVIIQGLTIYKDLLTTVLWGQGAMPATATPTASQVLVGVTPAVLCLDPTDFGPNATATLVVTHLTDCSGNMILTDEPGTINSLAQQFGRKPANVSVVEACLPQGRYAMNLVYGTGQAWTDPNEAGVCQAGEPEMMVSGKPMCVAGGPPTAERGLLGSQDVVLTIGPPSDPSYCAQSMHQTPAACCPAGVNTTTGACN